jgi:hypothetical protein
MVQTDGARCIGRRDFWIGASDGKKDDDEKVDGETDRERACRAGD